LAAEARAGHPVSLERLTPRASGRLDEVLALGEERAAARPAGARVQPPQRLQPGVAGGGDVGHDGNLVVDLWGGGGEFIGEQVRTPSPRRATPGGLISSAVAGGLQKPGSGARRLAGELGKTSERLGVADGDVGQDLAIDLHAGAG